jgi:3-(3-hydroxy-phenyl)propionate hydroxylase
MRRSNTTANTSPYADTAFVNGYEFTQGSAYVLPEYPFVAPPEIASGELVTHDVVIVGGGLAGLTLACALANLGVNAVLLDEDNTVGVKGAASRGICYTQKSLEIFDRLGLYEAIAAKGIQWSIGRTFAGDDEVYSFDLSAQTAYKLSSQAPFINIQQFYIEAFLVDRIGQLNAQKTVQINSKKPIVELRWQNRVTHFEQDADCARLTVSTPAGAYALQARHVIDATGANSRFRAWCSATTTAKKGDDRWCIADVRFAKHPPTERHTWIEAPFNDNRAVWQHLMADDVWRIDYQMAPNADPQYVSREDVVRERLARQFGADTELEIVWVGPYAYRSECIDQMRHGRVFFMGDSAKVVSPFGARGGNTGIADADNLAWKLAAVLRGYAVPALLDSYHQERHEAAKENVLVTNRTVRFLRPADGMERVFRSAVIALAKRHAFARPFVNTGRMAVANSYQFSSACGTSNGRKGGISLQNIAFELPLGGAAKPRAVRATVSDLLRWADGRLLVLAFGPVSAAGLKALRTLSQFAPVQCVQVLAPGEPPQAVEHIIDRNVRGAGQLALGCHVERPVQMSVHMSVQLLAQKPSQKPSRIAPTQWVLVRPDGYLASTGTALNGSVVRAVQQSLGLSA